MKKVKVKFAEEISDFPVQDTFNLDSMIITEVEEAADDICSTDRQTGSGE